MDSSALEAIGRTAIQSAERDYQDLTRVFGVVDSKAQNTATIAGVLIGAILTVTGRTDFRVCINILGSLLLVPLLVAALALFAAVLVSLLTMHVRAVPAPLTTKEALRTFENCIALKDPPEVDQCRVGLCADLLKLWDPVLARLSSVHERKARRLLLAQRLLGVGLALVAVSVIELLLVSSGG